MAVSENSVPLNPMVNDHYLSLLNGYNWVFRQTHIMIHPWYDKASQFSDPVVVSGLSPIFQVGI